MKKKVNIFGKGIPVFVLALILVAGLGSAALLTYYGTITADVTAEQSVLVDGGNYQNALIDEIPEASPGGERFCFKHTLENRASVSAEIDLENDCEASAGAVNCNGAYKTHYIIPDEVTLELCSKDNTWECDDRMNATLTFDPVNTRFVGTLTTQGLENIDYALIYYADEPERFENWGGENPGKVIFTFNGDQTDETFNVNLGMNLPTAPDANIDEYNYCGTTKNEEEGLTGDDYDTCHGAKLWIVPTDALSADNKLPMDEWVQSEYLFETDLIVYFDCNLGVPSNYPVDAYEEYIGKSAVIDSKETVDFLNCYEFDIAIKPGKYTFTTEVVPVTA